MDAVLETCLEEVVGGKRPPDLKSNILRRLKSQQAGTEQSDAKGSVETRADVSGQKQPITGGSKDTLPSIDTGNSDLTGRRSQASFGWPIAVSICLVGLIAGFALMRLKQSDAEKTAQHAPNQNAHQSAAQNPGQDPEQGGGHDSALASTGSFQHPNQPPIRSGDASHLVNDRNSTVDHRAGLESVVESAIVERSPAAAGASERERGDRAEDVGGTSSSSQLATSERAGHVGPNWKLRQRRRYRAIPIVMAQLPCKLPVTLRWTIIRSERMIRRLSR